MRNTLSITLLLAAASAANAFTVAPSLLTVTTSTKSKVISFSEAKSSSSSCDNATKKENENEKQPLIQPLQPFPPAMDPNYKNFGPIGENDFILTRSGPPTKEELSNENLYKILMIECSDLEVNTLVWKCLGYRFDEEDQQWKNDDVFPKWREKYDSPPDLIGMQRIYTKEVDQVSLKANQSLVRSVPVDNKQSLKTHLRPLGFTGYKVRVVDSTFFYISQTIIMTVIDYSLPDYSAVC